MHKAANEVAKLVLTSSFACSFESCRSMGFAAASVATATAAAIANYANDGAAVGGTVAQN